MNACDLSSSGLTRGSSVLKTWMPDQVGHDSCELVGHAYLSVIPAHAGIHAFKTWIPDQVGHDSCEVVVHDSCEVVVHDSCEVVGHGSCEVVGHGSCEVIGHDSFVVIPAKAGIHARKPWWPFQACYDGQRGTA